MLIEKTEKTISAIFPDINKCIKNDRLLDRLKSNPVYLPLTLTILKYPVYKGS